MTQMLSDRIKGCVSIANKLNNREKYLGLNTTIYTNL